MVLAGDGKIVNSERDVEDYPSLPSTEAPFPPEEWDLATMTRRPERPAAAQAESGAAP
jgi:hypothetical protein